MRRTSFLSVILFIIAGWFSFFFFWNFIEFNNHIRGLFNEGGLTFRGNEYEVISFYMKNCAPYAFYALMTGVLGRVLNKIGRRTTLV